MVLLKEKGSVDRGHSDNEERPDSQCVFDKELRRFPGGFHIKF